MLIANPADIKNVPGYEVYFTADRNLIYKECFFVTQFPCIEWQIFFDTALFFTNIRPDYFADFYNAAFFPNPVTVILRGSP